MNLILALTLPLAVGAQPQQLPPPGAVPMPMGFTFVRVVGPFGSKTTWYPETSMALANADGETIGLRPGYSYRFELSQLGSKGKAVIWPSIEVRGALIPRPNLNVMDHPIPIVFSDDEIERILSGRFMSKVYYLEDPDQAFGGPQPFGVPLETSAASEEEAIKEARARGRVMVILRAGERLWTRDELAHENVPGTVWAPRLMKSVPAPITRPNFLFAAVPLHDPLLGPNMPTGECLHDGGDRGLNLGIGRENRLYGLDPSDTAFEYSTPGGRKVVSSNRVCICVPRFAVERVELLPAMQHVVAGPQIGTQAAGQQALVHKLPTQGVAAFDTARDTVGGVRPSGLYLDTAPVSTEGVLGKPAAVANMNGARVTAQVRQPEDISTFPDCNLILVKRMDPPNPKQIGEVVTFYLSYRNPGTQPMTDLVVSDSLTGRLEYIDGSAKSDRGATFTATPNDAGSVVLRWKIDSALLPGHKGVVSFQARIR